MNLGEWRDAVVSELRAAGFSVSDYRGWPLVAHPGTMDDAVRFLKWVSPSGAPVCKTLYAEGALITPEPVERFTTRQEAPAS